MNREGGVGEFGSFGGGSGGDFGGGGPPTFSAAEQLYIALADVFTDRAIYPEIEFPADRLLSSAPPDFLFAQDGWTVNPFTRDRNANPFTTSQRASLLAFPTDKAIFLEIESAVDRFLSSAPPDFLSAQEGWTVNPFTRDRNANPFTTSQRASLLASPDLIASNGPIQENSSGLTADQVGTLIAGSPPVDTVEVDGEYYARFLLNIGGVPTYLYYSDRPQRWWTKPVAPSPATTPPTQIEQSAPAAPPTSVPSDALPTSSPSPFAFAAHNPVDFADPAGLAKSALGRTDRWNLPPPRFGDSSSTSRQELRPGIPDSADNVIRVEVGNSSITMSEDMFDNLQNASHLLHGEAKENARVFKLEKGPDDPYCDPRCQANARYRWAVLRHLEDRLTAQRIYDEVFLPVLKANPGGLLLGAAAPPGPSGPAGPQIAEDDAPREMSNEAMLTMYAFEANAVAEIRLRSTGLPRESFGPWLYADKGRFMQEYINNMIVENPAAARRVITLGRNFTEEPDWIPRTPAGGAYDFRTRVNYDLFPLNERQRRIHFNRSYGVPMRGIYFFNARPVVIRAGK